MSLKKWAFGACSAGLILTAGYFALPFAQSVFAQKPELVTEKVAATAVTEGASNAILGQEAIKIDDHGIQVGDVLKMDDDGIEVNAPIKIDENGIKIGDLIKIDDQGISVGGVPILSADSKPDPSHAVKKVQNDDGSVTELYPEGHSAGFDGVGDFSLKDTVVDGDVAIVGTFQAKDSTIDSLTVTGSVDFHDVVVKQGADITGSAQLNDAVFEGNVNITGEEFAAADSVFQDLSMTGSLAHFNHVTAKNVTITKNDKKKTSEEADITLANHSVVKNIRFPQGHGLVVLEGGSEVEGQIVGARVVRH